MPRKFPTAFTILFVLIVVVAALTWIIPAGQYERALNPALGKEAPVPGTYTVVEFEPAGSQRHPDGADRRALQSCNGNGECDILQTPRRGLTDFVPTRTFRGPPRLDLSLVGLGSNPAQLRGWCYPTGREIPRSRHGSARMHPDGSAWSLLAEYSFAVLFPEQVRSNNANLCFNFPIASTSAGAPRKFSLGAADPTEPLPGCNRLRNPGEERTATSRSRRERRDPGRHAGRNDAQTVGRSRPALFRRARNGDLVEQRHRLHTSGSKPKDRRGPVAFTRSPQSREGVRCARRRQSRIEKAGFRLVS